MNVPWEILGQQSSSLVPVQLSTTNGACFHMLGFAAATGADIWTQGRCKAQVWVGDCLPAADTLTVCVPTSSQSTQQSSFGWKHYLCMPAAPGRPSAAAGRCKGQSEHSMWMAFFGFEALKTNKSRTNILSHLSHYKLCLFPAISGLATLKPQCFPVAGSPARLLGPMNRPGLCTAIHPWHLFLSWFNQLTSIGT